MTNKSLRLDQEILDLSTAKVMAILNINADSFYGGSRFTKEDEILKASEKALSEGASFLDIGACSSRPGSQQPELEEEWKRLEPALKCIRANFPDCLISVDTFRAEIVKRSAQYNIQMVNDISAGQLDDKLLETVGKLNLAYNLMHMKGVPKTMQDHTQYLKGLMQEMEGFFSTKLKALREYGINQVCIDPGFGFAKDMSQNYEILGNLERFRHFQVPILVGISRKSMLYKALNYSPDQALNATTAAHMIALQKGANILRVHDVKEAVEAVKIHTFVQNPQECYSS